MQRNLQDGEKVCGTLGCRQQGQIMAKHIDPSGIEIDTCRGCGTVALDPGELQEIIRYTANGTRARLGGQQIPRYREEVVVVETGGYGRRRRSSSFSSLSDLFSSIF